MPDFLGSLTNQDLSQVVDPKTTKYADRDPLTPCYPILSFDRQWVDELKASGYVHSNVKRGSSFYCEVSSKTGINTKVGSPEDAEQEYRLRRAMHATAPHLNPVACAIDAYWDEVVKDESQCNATKQPQSTAKPTRSRKRQPA